MPRTVSSVECLGAHRLRLGFDDGVTGEVDLADLDFTGVFAPLADPLRFAEVRIDAGLGTIVWPNGADLDPQVLYARITGRPLPGAEGCGGPPLLAL